MGAERIIVIETVAERMALEQAVQAVRPSGIVSVPGVHAGPVPVNMATMARKGLTIRSGQTHVRRYSEPLAKLLEDNRIGPTFLITHRSKDLAEGLNLYKTFRDKKDSCVKVVVNLG